MPPDRIADRAANVSPSNTLTLFVDEGFPHARYLYIGSGGNLKFTDASGVSQAQVVAAGWFWCAVYQVFSTGTDASNIVAFY